jgi:hypothetical protein
MQFNFVELAGGVQRVRHRYLLMAEQDPVKNGLCISFEPIANGIVNFWNKPTCCSLNFPSNEEKKTAHELRVTSYDSGWLQA